MCSRPTAFCFEFTWTNHSYVFFLTCSYQIFMYASQRGNRLNASKWSWLRSRPFRLSELLSLLRKGKMCVGSLSFFTVVWVIWFSSHLFYHWTLLDRVTEGWVLWDWSRGTNATCVEIVTWYSRTHLPRCSRQIWAFGAWSTLCLPSQHRWNEVNDLNTLIISFICWRRNRGRQGLISAKKVKNNLLAAVLILTVIPPSVKVSQAVIGHCCFLISQKLLETDEVR